MAKAHPTQLAIRNKRPNLLGSRKRWDDLDEQTQSSFLELTAAAWNEGKNPLTSRQLLRTKLKARSVEMGLDPATIMFLIQIAILIFKELKRRGVFDGVEMSTVLPVFEEVKSYAISA